MLFSDKQLSILEYDNKVKPFLTILEGSVRSSKTYINNWLFLKHINKFIGQRRQFILTGKTLSTIERNVLMDIRDTFGLKFNLDKYNRFELLGNIINCFGTDTQEAFKGLTGFTSYGWYANEVTLHNQTAVKEALTRCSGEGSRIFWDCNPDAPNHPILIDYINKADGNRIKSWHFTLDDNPFLTAEYIDNLKRLTPSGVFYDRKILGLWTSAEGMIFKDWNSDTMIIDIELLPIINRYFAGVDWGYDHLGCIVVIGEDYDGNCYLIREYTEREKNIDYWLNVQKEIIKLYGNMPFYCDSARPEYVEAFHGIEAKKDVVEGIEHIAGLMKKNKFKVLRNNAPEFLREIYLYRWDTNGIKEQPIKRDDDVIDSIRYALYTDYISRVIPALGDINAMEIKESFNY